SVASISFCFSVSSPLTSIARHPFVLAIDYLRPFAISLLRAFHSHRQPIDPEPGEEETACPPPKQPWEQNIRLGLRGETAWASERGTYGRGCGEAHGSGHRDRRVHPLSLLRAAVQTRSRPSP